MTMFPMTLGDPEPTPNTQIFAIFVAFHIFVLGIDSWYWVNVEI